MRADWHLMDFNPIGYAERWLRCLRIDNITEPWHLDVIQEQFIDGEARSIRRDFVRRHAGLSTSGVPEQDRIKIAATAAALLRRHGREPRINPFWLAAVNRDPAENGAGTRRANRL